MHYAIALQAQSVLKKAASLDRIVSLVGEAELSDEDRVIYNRATKLKNFMTQDFYVAQGQTKRPGVYVTLKATLTGVKDIIDGKFDTVSPDKFLNVGGTQDILNVK